MSAAMVASRVKITTSTIEKMVTPETTVVRDNTFLRSKPPASRPVEALNLRNLAEYTDHIKQHPSN